MQKYAQVIIGVPVEKVFYYTLPEEMAHEVTPGKRVIVPFSGRKLTGYVVGLSLEKPNVDLREISEIVDLFPLFDGEMLKLTKWVSDYYCCTWGETLRAAFPPGVRAKKWSLPQEKHFSAAKLSTPSSFSPEPELLHATTEERLKLYLKQVGQTLEDGRGALILVPDISRSKSILKAIEPRFGQTTSLLHGHLSPGERYREWMKMKSGMSRVVIGTRSAVFAPLENLGLIIVDEEDNPSYKEKRTPKYHAREVALKRARLSGAQVMLGAQTPSLESYFQAERGKYQLLAPAREERKKLPEVEIADLSHEFKSRRVCWALSLALRQEIEDRLKRGEQTVLLASRGAGTQRIMDKLGRLFPRAHLGKVGTAATYEETIDLFHRGKIDILIGTQTVLKELGAKRISLLGIISADTILNIDNFRAAEKTFQLLMRVVNSFLGRQNSKVIIQTYNPDHYSILSAARDDYPQFYREEIEFRRQLNYPPLTSLINITIKDKEAFKRLTIILEANRVVGSDPTTVDILVSAPSSKIRLSKRWQIIVKGGNLSRMREVIRKELIAWNKTKVNVDVDPL